MIVVSDARCNIINSDSARKLVNNGDKSVQKKTKMYPYSSPIIISHHYIQGTVITTVIFWVISYLSMY